MDQNEGSNTKDKLKKLKPRNSLLLDVHGEIHNSSSSDILIVIDENNEPENKSESHSSQKDNSENGEENAKESSSEGRTVLSPPKDPRMVRSSSLKLEKESPGTSREKKMVRFADALGLDLADVHVFGQDEDLPNVPSSAFYDLVGCNKPKSKDDFLNESYTFTPQFEQPGSDAYFLEKVKQEKVCLENVLVEGLKVTGVVRILNIGYEKKVLARYTTNHWMSFTDHTAEYVPRSSDELTDKFKFTIYPRFMQPGSKLSLVVKYEVNSDEFWDNNQGKNYSLMCEVKKDPHQNR
ncbi:glycogen-binding subunit 76A [Trichonephila clavata]|uniref:Glycogen-binding subunit 76A n=1 Tax=Trichonephila clavata TaxID=2740835 RepID=A0A8X6J8I6_TRICU|nr:glycogen-binding subunit 76A [Trichonephila clavata]